MIVNYFGKGSYFDNKTPLAIICWDETKEEEKVQKILSILDDYGWHNEQESEMAVIELVGKHDFKHLNSDIAHIKKQMKGDK